MLARFRVAERGSTLRTEIVGGITTFVSMAYIIVVNPAILEFAGIPSGPSTVATILTAAFGTLLMGLYANRPIAVAPYMGENAFIAFGLAAFGIGWQLRLGAVFVSGIVFLVITFLGVRTWLADAVSPSLKHSFAAGIGLFSPDPVPDVSPGHARHARRRRCCRRDARRERQLSANRKADDRRCARLYLQRPGRHLHERRIHRIRDRHSRPSW